MEYNPFDRDTETTEKTFFSKHASRRMKQSAGWMRFLAIFSIVTSSFSLLAGFAGGAGQAAQNFVSFAISLVMAIFMLQGAAHLRDWVNKNNNSADLELFAQKMRNYYLMQGILMIIVLCVAALMIPVLLMFLSNGFN